MALYTMEDTAAAPETSVAPDAMDEFLELEAKIAHVADALLAARAERDDAVAQLGTLRAAHEKLQHAQSEAERELVGLRKERHEIRQRVSRLVKQLEGADS